MFVDNENQLSTGGTAGQSMSTFTVGTNPAGNVIDSGPLGGQNTPSQNAGRDWGTGYPAWLVILFTTAPTSGGAATIDMQLVSSASPALTSPNVMVDLTGGALAYNGGKFNAGQRYAIALPRAGIGGTTGWLRYIGINFIVATAALTGGVFNAFLTRDVQDNLLYQAGFLVA
jgi:hypothetical protein